VTGSKTAWAFSDFAWIKIRWVTIEKYFTKLNGKGNRGMKTLILKQTPANIDAGFILIWQNQTSSFFPCSISLSLS